MPNQSCSLTIAAQPTSSANGLPVGLQGTIASLGPGGSGIKVDALVDNQGRCGRLASTAALSFKASPALRS
jgi:hypothetical protein